VVGGADSLCRFTVNGFHALQALAAQHCNPFSRNRDGINIGEGAAAFLVTAEPGPIMLLGMGETSDAHHVSAPDPEGKGAARSITLALDAAGLEPDAIQYINLHGTATPLNDAMEGRVVGSIFGTRVPCSSTKGMTGHMLGAAGACEAAFLWLALKVDISHGALPPHVWDGVRDPEIPMLNLTSLGDRGPVVGQSAMASSSFAFGGSNATLVLGRGERP
jgi:3-oxoacyl-[acyl-carrier-protein] synthase-1